MGGLRGDERQVLLVVRYAYLKVIMQRDDIGVTNGHSLEDSDLVTDLRNHQSAVVSKPMAQGGPRRWRRWDWANDVTISAH